MLAEEKAAASRFFAIMAGLLGAAGVVVTVWMLAQNGGMFPGLKPWLAALAATVANALCLPFVAGYWHTAGKPAGARWLMITQGLGLLAFGLVYLANLSS